MTKRTVNTGMVTYTGTDGTQRMGLRDEEVDVQPGAALTRFDALNGVITAEAPSKPAPAKKAAPKKRAPRK